MFAGLTFSKTRILNPTLQFLKVNTYLHLITNDLKFLNIHNWTQPRENRCLKKTWVNLTFSYLDCATFQLQRKKNSYLVSLKDLRLFVKALKT
jgi:hypothetical protein